MKNAGQDLSGTFSDLPETGAGPGAFTVSVAQNRDGNGLSGKRGNQQPLFDHEKLEVYRVAREFLTLVTKILERKMSRELHEQFDRATMSILFNIGEGAGKTSKDDKRRFYEIARGSATEAATQLDLMHIRAIISNHQYTEARSLLLRVSQMLSRLCSNPRLNPASVHRSPANRP